MRVLRSRRHLEQVELARSCGWRDASAVSRIETDRIRPTRRTLVRLAESLADPAVTGSAENVRAWLFYAAGILPTGEELTALGPDIPDIDAWSQPAVVIDFGWTIWRANPLFRTMLGLPDDVAGRNLLDLFFETNGSIRTHLGDRWERSAAATLRQFRSENDRKSHQRWYRGVVARLERSPDFRRLWDQATVNEPEQVSQRFRQTTSIGTFALLRMPLNVDPRLSLMHLVPEDAEAVRALHERAITT